MIMIVTIQSLLVLIVGVSAEPGFFYSTGYYPFGHFSPLSYAYSPLLHSYYHTPLALSYSGCRNVHGAEVPCALPSVAPAVAAVAAVAPVESAAAEAEAVDVEALTLRTERRKR